MDISPISIIQAQYTIIWMWGSMMPHVIFNLNQHPRKGGANPSQEEACINCETIDQLIHFSSSLFSIGCKASERQTFTHLRQPIHASGFMIRICLCQGRLMRSNTSLAQTFRHCQQTVQRLVSNSIYVVFVPFLRFNFCHMSTIICAKINKMDESNDNNC